MRVLGIAQNVEDMNDFALKQNASGYRSSVESKRVTCGELSEFRREPIARFEVEELAPWSAYGHRVGLAQPRRRLHQRVEHDLQIEGRAADDLKHVRGGGLLLQRLAQLVEQARVLDGDDGLAGKILDQLDLLVCKRVDFLAVYRDSAEQLLFLEHWDSKIGPSAGKFDQGNDGIIALDIGLLSPEIGNVDYLLGSDEAS